MVTDVDAGSAGAAMCRRTALAGIALLLFASGCTVGPSKAPPSAAYFAMGTEPGWTLEIAGDRLVYSGDYGTVRIAERARAVGAGDALRRLVGRRLDVTVRPGPCNDGMSDRVFPDQVVIVADGKRFVGCGGLPRPTR